MENVRAVVLNWWLVRELIVIIETGSVGIKLITKLLDILALEYCFCL